MLTFPVIPAQRESRRLGRADSRLPSIPAYDGMTRLRLSSRLTVKCQRCLVEQLDPVDSVAPRRPQVMQQKALKVCSFPLAWRRLRRRRASSEAVGPNLTIGRTVFEMGLGHLDSQHVLVLQARSRFRGNLWASATGELYLPRLPDSHFRENDEG